MAEKKQRIEKTVTHTYRSSQTAFNLSFILRIKTNIVGDKFCVTEQRSGFIYEGTMFWGSEQQCRDYFDERQNKTITCPEKPWLAL